MAGTVGVCGEHLVHLRPVGCHHTLSGVRHFPRRVCPRLWIPWQSKAAPQEDVGSDLCQLTAWLLLKPLGLRP